MRTFTLGITAAAMLCAACSNVQMSQSAIIGVSDQSTLLKGSVPANLSERKFIATYFVNSLNDFYLTSGADGNIWISGNSYVAKVTTIVNVTTFAIPSPYTGDLRITRGPAKTVWMPLTGASVSPNVAKIATQSGIFTVYPLPMLASNYFPDGLVMGSDHRIYMTDTNNDVIYRITSSGNVVILTPPTSGSMPTAIALGSDGNIWFIENGVQQIAKITTAGTFSEFPLGPTGTVQGDQLVSGADGNLYAAGDSGKLYQISTAGSVLRGFSCKKLQFTIDAALGPDRQIWFTNSLGIFEFNPSTGICSNTVKPPNTAPGGITEASDKNMWMTATDTSNNGYAVVYKP